MQKKRWNHICKSGWQKIFIMARAMVFLMYVGLLQVSASVYSQETNLHLKVEKASISAILKMVEEQSDFLFLYRSDYFKEIPEVTLNMQNVKLEEVLNKLIVPYGFTYEVDNKTVVIKRSTSIADRKSAEPQKRTISGTVMDSKGLPIPGATVIIKGTTVGITADNDGKFQLTIPNNATTLAVSFIGMKTQEVAINGQNFFSFTLEDATVGLEEVVAIGYGKQKKSSIVSAISGISSKQISLPTRNLSNNLGGQIAGLISIQRSGEPGQDDATFWIRGISTFAGGTSPLVLVDGIPRAMNDIEPDEIESFAILKDAAATAVYGAEGANGVVLVTTKRGQAQKGVISFKTEQGFSQPTRLPEFVGSAQYLELANEALKNDGLSPVFTDDLIAKYRNNVDPDLYPNVNWMDECLKKLSTNHRYTMNFRGGSEKARYFVSGAYYNEDGIFKSDPTNKYENNIGLKRYNLRSNIDIDVTKTTILNVDISGQYTMLNDPGSTPTNIFRFMLNTPSYLFPAVYSDGTLSTYPIESDGNNRNPYNMLMNSGYTKEWRAALQSNVGIQQKLDMITKGLSFSGKASFDYNGVFGSSRTYNPSRYYATGRDVDGKLIFSQSVSGTPDMGDPTETNSANKKIYIEGALNYNRVFGPHKVSGMVLYNQKETQYHNEALAYRKQGAVGRLTYSYDDRYFIEGNFGYTGSEAFAAGHRFGFFPAVGVGYYVSNEKFYPEQLKKIVSKLKVRASVGRTGNDDTGTSRFLYRPTYNMAATGFNQGITSGGGSNYAGAGIVEGQFANNDLSWEIEDKQNYGVDLGFFNNKIEIVADYFNSNRRDILLQRKTIPTSAGFQQNPWENYGKVNNKGIDGSIEGHQSFGPVKISMRGTFTYARNKILEYDELPTLYPWMAFTGTRVSENTLYHAERLYTDNDFIITQNANGTNSYKLKPELPSVALQGLLGPGDIKFQDVNNDGIINTYDRIRGVGNPYNPEISYGFGLNLEYKGFYISSFFQGTGNCSVVINQSGGNFAPFAWGYAKSNFRTLFLDRWTPENPSQDVVSPRLHSNNTYSVNKEGSDWWLRNGSFIRFKNFEVGYNIPKDFLKKINLASVRVYALGYNLAVWDHIKYWDPETGSDNAGMAYPLSRTITLGLELTF